MKKVISLLITLSMLLSLALPAFGENAAESVTNAGYKETIASLTTMDTINKTGLVPSTKYTKSGPFSALMNGANLKRSIDISIDTNDFSKANYIEFYMHNEVSSKNQFGLALFSDNPATPSKDYYVAKVKLEFEGWEHVSLGKDDFEISGTPLGLDKIDKITIMPTYGKKPLDASNSICFDEFQITSEMSEDANAASKAGNNKVYVLADPADGPLGGTVVTEKDGIPCYEWRGEKNLQRGMGIKIPENLDLSTYGYLRFKVYSEKNTGNNFNICFTSNMPDSDEWSYYKTGFQSNWEGGWQEFEFILKDGAGGDFGAARTPNGWDNATKLDITATGWDAPFYPDTAVYISRITVEGAPVEEIDKTDGDYILDNRYDSATMTDFMGKIKEKHPDNHHPRLILTDEKIAQIKKYKDTDVFLKKAVNKIVEASDVYLQKPVTKYYIASGTPLLDWTPSTLIPTCILSYIITDDVRYKDRAWQEIENICNYPNWNSSHFLDGSEFARAIAFAYDWIYDEWTEEERMFMRNSVMDLYYVNALKQLRTGMGSWLSQRSNWIEVGACGVGLCALAFGDEKGYEDLCNEMLNRTIGHLPEKGMFMFAPDGAYSEGMSYWNYALYTFFMLTNSMNTAMGDDAGLEELSGLSKTGYFPLAMNGAMGCFAFSDTGPNSFMTGAPVFHYVGERYDLPNLTSFRVQYGTDLDYRDVIWYNPESTYMADYTVGLPLDYFASGHEPLGSARSGYKKDSYYFGFKGGNNKGNHDQLDIGSFVIDANGVRWAEELGPETYYPSSDRKLYYRMRAEGNNVLVVNPDSRDGQVWEDTICDYTLRASSESAAVGVFDLYKAYRDDLSAYKRGFGLINNRSQFIIRDEFTAIKPSTIYSFYHLRKDINVEFKNNNKTVILTAPNGKRCQVDLVTDISGAKFDVMNAEHLPSSSEIKPKDNDGADNSNYKKLFVRAGDVTGGYISVIYTPLLTKDDKAVLPADIPLNEWEKYTASSNELEMIYVDGLPIDNFSPGVGVYAVRGNSIGKVSAKAPEGTKISIVQAEALGDTAVINVTSGDITTNYKVSFTTQLIPTVSTGTEIVAVKASAVPQIENTPEKTFDGDSSTRWSAENEQWLVWDLGKVKGVNGVSLSFMSGNQRCNIMTIEVSEDGTNYTKVFDGRSGGKTTELEFFPFDTVKARYVRYTGFGCDDGNGTMLSPWNSITEVVIHEDYLDFDDTISHWAKEDINFLRKYKLVNGISETLFAPDDTLSTAQFITMICRAADIPASEYKGGFSDVSSSDWFAGHVASAIGYDLLPSEMTSDGVLGPNDPLSRDAMCAITVKAYEYIMRKDAPMHNLTSKFSDVNDSVYLSHIDKAIGLKLVNGVTDSVFEPYSNLTRAQAAAITKRFFLKIYNDLN